MHKAFITCLILQAGKNIHNNLQSYQQLFRVV